MLLSNIMKDFSGGNNFKKEANILGTNQNNEQNMPPILCLWFTSFKNKARRRHIHLNTLYNWAKFLPLMQPVLFSANSTRLFDSIARQLGWHVYEIPRVNDYGTPYIADTLDVIANNDKYNSIFYGFANGDILFDTSLAETLKSLVRRRITLPMAPILVTGQRTNIKNER